MAAFFAAVLSAAGSFMSSIRLVHGGIHDGPLRFEDGDFHPAFRWFFVPSSCQLILLLDHGLRPRPTILLCLKWIDGKLWADADGNYLVLITDTLWQMAAEFRVSAPLHMLPPDAGRPVLSFHWLSGKSQREFIVGFEDGGCAFWGLDERWTVKHGACRLFCVDESVFLIVKFHFAADVDKARVSVFEKVKGAYFTPVKDLPQLHVLVKFLCDRNFYAEQQLVNSYERLNPPKVAVVPVCEIHA